MECIFIIFSFIYIRIDMGLEFSTI